MDQDEVDVLVAYSTYLLIKKQQKKRRPKRYWVHPLFRARDKEGEFHTIVSRLRDKAVKFVRYF